MTENKWKQIKYPALVTYIQEELLNFNLHRDIVAGPQSLLVFNNGTLYGTQVQKHIYALIKFRQLRKTSQNTTSETAFNCIKWI